MKTVGEIVCERPLLYVDDAMTVYGVARFMTERRIGAVPVLAGDRLAGVFSERDLMTRVVVPGHDPRAVRVREVMTCDLVIAAPDESLVDCQAKMVLRGCRHLPVVSEGRLLGFVSLRDLLQSHLDEKIEELAMMTHYVQYVPPEVERRFGPVP